jgi:hypothetical protein
MESGFIKFLSAKFIFRWNFGGTRIRFRLSIVPPLGVPGCAADRVRRARVVQCYNIMAREGARPKII